MKKGKYIAIVIVTAIFCLLMRIHAECSEKNPIKFMEYYHKSRKEMADYAYDFYEQDEKVIGDTEIQIANSLGETAIDYIEYLDIIADLVTIHYKINKVERKAVAINFCQCRDRIIKYLEYRIGLVNINLNHSKNQNIVIVGNQMKRKQREIIARLKSLSFD